MTYYCDELTNSRREAGNGFPGNGSRCADGQESTFLASITDAGSTRLPPGAGIKVGVGTESRFLVVDVHLYDVTRDWRGWPADFGLDLTLAFFPLARSEGGAAVTEERPRRLEILTAESKDGVLAADAVTHVESVCRITSRVPIQAIAFDTHGHARTHNVTAWKVDS